MNEASSQNEKFSDEIGSIARILDSKFTMMERMKITKQNVKRISMGVVFYSVMMLIFSALL